MRVVDSAQIPQARGETAAGFVSSGALPPAPVIAGWGMVTALGGSTKESWHRLLAGEFIRDHARAPIACPDDEPRVTALARLAAAQALEMAGAAVHVSPPERGPTGHTRLTQPAKTALVVGTSKGPVENWLKPAGQRGAGINPAGLGAIADSLASRFRIAGPRLTLSAACASGLHALIRGAMLIQSREADRVLVVAAEASLHPLFLANFKRLGVLPRVGVGCRPFDHSREGFLMSEAAAAVFLVAREEGEAACSGEAGTTGRRAKGDNPTIILDRFAMGGDATHLTGGDPDARTLRHLLRRVIDGRPVDLVHAHGTGTIVNDETELAAIEASVSEQRHPPALYSHKGALGHSLGAAGLVSVVLNCQAHTSGTIPPNVQTRDPLPAVRVNIAAAAVHRRVRRSTAIAAGFGGATAVVSLLNG